jgi:hypothetical protein
LSRIAPEIDELMWTIAQQRDPQAIDEFGQRFPELRQELGKRLALTNSLKTASVATRPHSIPRFTPRQAPPPWWTKPTALALAGAVLVVLAMGSYSLSRAWSQPVTKVVPGESAPVQKPIEDATPDGRGEPMYKQDDPQPEGRTPTPKPADVPPYMQPKSLDVQSARLPAVLAMIEAACGLDIDMPDMPADLADLDVEARYENMNGLAMLADMGSKYGFTAFHQGGNKVLIVPARPTSAETGGD